TAGVTSGNVHDAKLMDRLIRDDDTAVYGDKGYASGAKKRAAEAAGVLWAVKEKAKPGGRLTAPQRARNHRFGKVRAKVEHVFRVVKCQFGYRKVRYRGIAKNGAQVFSLLALANLYLARSRLRPHEGDWSQDGETPTPSNRRAGIKSCYSEVPPKQRRRSCEREGCRPAEAAQADLQRPPAHS